MYFPSVPQDIAPPLALQAIDDQLGTQTQDAYRTAVSRAPHLNGLAVMLDEDRSRFLGSPLGLPGSSIMLNPDPKYYSDAIRSGIVNKRMGEFSELYRSKGITPGVNELIVAVMLHEMGHADDLAGFVEMTDGDTAEAFMLANRVRKSELSTLPLKAATSRAQTAWDGNINGYQDLMRERGITDESWEALKAANTVAYAELPCEKVADTFALGVLATVNA